MVSIELIKQKKSIYGDNFECIAKEWSKFLKSKLGISSAFRGLSGAEVAKMMLLMKECRLDVISEKLEFCEDEKIVGKLEEALSDSLKDRDNYKWIAENYKKYKKL